MLATPARVVPVGASPLVLVLPAAPPDGRRLVPRPGWQLPLPCDHRELALGAAQF